MISPLLAPTVKLTNSNHILHNKKQGKTSIKSQLVTTSVLTAINMSLEVFLLKSRLTKTESNGSQNKVI